MTVSDDATLCGFIERLLGWSNDVAVELALRSVELAAAGDTALALIGPGDMVPIAQALHMRVRGPDRPFIVPTRGAATRLHPTAHQRAAATQRWPSRQLVAARSACAHDASLPISPRSRRSCGPRRT